MHADRVAISAALGALDALALRRVYCSNEDPGLAHYLPLRAAPQSAAAQLGVGSEAAHVITGHSRPQPPLEEELAGSQRCQRASLVAKPCSKTASTTLRSWTVSRFRSRTARHVDALLSALERVWQASSEP